MRVSAVRLRCKYVSVAVGLLTAASLSATVSAAGGQSLTISPTSTQTAIAAGKSTSGVLKLIDDGATPITVSLSASPYGVTGEAYKPLFKKSENFSDASKWFKFAKNEYKLQPHEYLEVPYTITVPAGTGPGGYYAVAFASTEPPKGQSTGVQTQSRVGSIFYLRVNGSTSEVGKVASWKADFLQTKPPLTATLRLENSGNIHFETDTTVRFKNLLGGHETVVKDEHVVLPHTTRALTIRTTSGPTAGIFRVSGTTSFLRQTETLPAKTVILLPGIALGIVIAAIVLLVASVIGTIVQRRRRR